MDEVNALPAVARMQGLRLEPRGPDMNKAAVIAQYTDAAGQWHQLDLPYGDAMYLLELLLAVAAQTGYVPGGRRKQ